LELPVNSSLPFLDFRVAVSSDGVANFEFFRKPMRKDNFINSATALPKQMINNIIINENSRIISRCTNSDKVKHHSRNFINRLVRNGHKTNDLMRIKNRVAQNPRSVTNPNQTFFLSIPFLSDTIESKIKNSLKDLGLKVLISHKCKKMKHVLSSSNAGNAKCGLPNCKLNNKLCMAKGVVYSISCDKCKASYIGSTFRFLHLRFREHLIQRSSPIHAHNLKCNGKLCVQALSKDNNTQRMRIKEAILIKQLKPNLNGKEDLLRSHILFDCE
jgi:hypothetical protein